MSKIICRKCNGPHLTIKCKILQNNEVFLTNREPKNNEVILTNREPKNNEVFLTNREQKNIKQFNKVKINDLPINITEDELRELLHDWGHILYLSIKIYNNSANAIIKFGNDEEATYFVEALNGTPFEKNIIHVEKIN